MEESHAVDTVAAAREWASLHGLVGTAGRDETV